MFGGFPLKPRLFCSDGVYFQIITVGWDSAGCVSGDTPGGLSTKCTGWVTRTTRGTSATCRSEPTATETVTDQVRAQSFVNVVQNSNANLILRLNKKIKSVDSSSCSSI